MAQWATIKAKVRKKIVKTIHLELRTTTPPLIDSGDVSERSHVCHQIVIQMLHNPDWCMGVCEICPTAHCPPQPIEMSIINTDVLMCINQIWSV